MANICMLLQFILSFHVFYKAQAAENIAFWIVGSIALHFIVYLMIHLSHSKCMQTLFYIIDIIILIAAAILINNGFWLLIAAVNSEFTYWYHKKITGISTLVLLAYLVIKDLDLLREQGILFILIFFTLNVLFNYEEKMAQVKKINEELRDKLYQANRKVEYIQKEASQIEEVTKVQERNILVQKLHDKIGHTLAANIMQLEAIKIIVHNNKEEAVKMLARTIENLREGMDDIRHTLKEIKPEKSEMGLTQIRSILDELQNSRSIETELSFKGDLEVLNLNTWYVIAQNLKETITNLLKYSKADRLIVRIEVYHKIIKVKFKDNGLPIEHYKKGLGLMGIKERTQSINGRLVINTESGFETLMILSREDL